MRYARRFTGYLDNSNLGGNDMEYIPKKIHYCWFGKAPLPQSVRKCIESWKRYCPDYEIIQWDESNYDYTKNQYMLDAYNAKKFAFASDYARLDIIYTYGGIYLDTDVEVIRNLDELLVYDCFVGFERTSVALGLGFGAKKGNPDIKALLDEYESRDFINKDGSFNLTPIPKYTTNYFVKKGLVCNDTRQTIGTVTFFPTEFFCPKNILTGECVITSNTFSIHHYDATWWNESERKEHEKQVQLHKKSKWLWRIYNGIKIMKEEGIVSLIKKMKNMRN